MYGRRWEILFAASGKPMVSCTRTIVGQFKVWSACRYVGYRLCVRRNAERHSSVQCKSAPDADRNEMNPFNSFVGQHRYWAIGDGDQNNGHATSKRLAGSQYVAGLSKNSVNPIECINFAKNFIEFFFLQISVSVSHTATASSGRTYSQPVQRITNWHLLMDWCDTIQRNV